MTRRGWDRAGQAAVVAAAFGVGLLVGAEHCAPPPPPAPACPEPAPCPTEASAPAAAADSASPSPRPGRLPPAPAPEARHREALLAWAADQASDLATCGGDPARPVHLAVTLHLDDEGAVRDVSLGRDREALSVAQAACLAARLRRWRPPPDLVQARERLVFGLTL